MSALHGLNTWTVTFVKDNNIVRCRIKYHAAAGNRTQINCLEGNYANLYTTAACRKLVYHAAYKFLTTPQFARVEKKRISHTGNWTRAAWVKARNPNHWTIWEHECRRNEAEGVCSRCTGLLHINLNVQVQKNWQKWDSNPRREDPTATWTQRLRPLGHPAFTIDAHWQPTKIVTGALQKRKRKWNL